MDADSRSGLSSWPRAVLVVAMCLVAVLAVGMFVLHNMITHCGDMRREKAAADVYGIAESLHGFWVEHGSYPTTDQGLVAVASSALSAEHEPPWYALDKIPLDPWGNPYAYTSDGRKFVLKSYGADGKEGGRGDDADIERDSPLGG